MLRVAGALGARCIVVTSGGSLAEQARAEGVPVIPIPGGFQPRAAIAYLLVSALEVAAMCGCGPRLTTEIDVTADHLIELASPLGAGRAGRQLREGALRERCTAPCRSSAAPTPTRPIAYRWKTQINENAGVPAFCGELPELDHNEIAGWPGAGTPGPFSAIFLGDCDSHPRLRTRIELT